MKDNIEEQDSIALELRETLNACCQTELGKTFTNRGIGRLEMRI